MKSSKFQPPTPMNREQASKEIPNPKHPSLPACREVTARHQSLKFGASLVVSAWCLVLLVATSAFAQSYSIDWYKVSGGGGTSTGGVYSVSGTIGQPDAGGPMTGGNYSLTGGFWALISVVQTAGLPNLTITFVGPSVVVSWPNTGSYTLQTNNNLNASNWPGYGGTINIANGTNSVTITPPTGNLFFRLKQP
jgi:hypothetical protein